jgi:hypothetical protein
MSKYKVEMTLNIGLHGERSDEIDLVDESGHTEEEISSMGAEELEKLIYETWKDWAWNYIDGCGRLKIGGSDEDS